MRKKNHISKKANYKLHNQKEDPDPLRKAQAAMEVLIIIGVMVIGVIVFGTFYFSNVGRQIENTAGGPGEADPSKNLDNGFDASLLNDTVDKTTMSGGVIHQGGGGGNDSDGPTSSCNNNGTCGTGENCFNCSGDCGICCGQGGCQSQYGETADNCCIDCGTNCTAGLNCTDIEEQIAETDYTDYSACIGYCNCDICRNASSYCPQSTCIHGDNGGGQYVICNKDDFDYMRAHLDGDYLLGQDIDLGGANINRIGYVEDPFTGTFDGDNHKISNFVIELEDDGWASATGFFGAVNNATIQNLGLENIITAYSDNAGGLIGLANGSNTISNCYTTGTITGQENVGGLIGFSESGTVISNSYSTADVSGQLSTGGLIGKLKGRIESSYFDGSVIQVNGTQERQGGLVGYLDHGMIYSSHSSGTVYGGLVVGGLVGYNDYGTIARSYSTSNVFATTMEAGGFIGRDRFGVVENSYSRGDVTRLSLIGSDSTKFGGFVGSEPTVVGYFRHNYSTGKVIYEGTDNPTDKGFSGTLLNSSSCSFWDKDTSKQLTDIGIGVDGKSNNEMKTMSTYISGTYACSFNKFDFENVWDIDPTINGGYPYLRTKEVTATCNFNFVCDAGETINTCAHDCKTARMVFDTTKTASGSTNSNQIKLPVGQTFFGSHDFLVNWGDGKSNRIIATYQPEIIHTYATPGPYTVEITGMFIGVSFGNFSYSNIGDRQKLMVIEQWGPLRFDEGTGSRFDNCINLTITATDILDTTNMKNMSSFFENCYHLTNIPNIEQWDTSSVEDMSATFKSAINFNQPLNNLNVSSVKYMGDLFYGASTFNQPLDKWDTSNVVTMGRMFSSATSFNQPINYNPSTGAWNTSKVTYMVQMFWNASSFNQDISGWNVDAVENWTGIFGGCPLESIPEYQPNFN